MYADELTRADWRAMFEQRHPGFFDQPSVRAVPLQRPMEEMVLALGAFDPEAVRIPVPEGIRFGRYEGPIGPLRALVGRVDPGWPELFAPGERIYCAREGDRLASFCLLEDMGEYAGLRIGGPGCVGTLPEYRRQGIGLEMVRRATAILKEEGFDVSYIHYTGFARWYARLGYRTVLRWCGEGFID